MKKAVAVSLILTMLLFATMMPQNLIPVEGETQDVSFAIQITTTYLNPSNNTSVWDLTEEDRTIGLFMNNTWQTVYLTNQSHPLETTKIDEDGNPIGLLIFPESRLEPGKNVSCTVTYKVLSKPRSIPTISEDESWTVENILEDLKERYCREEGPWLVNDPKLQMLAHNTAGNETKVLTIVKKFVTWIRDNIRYSVEDYLYPNETVKNLGGACADQATLLTTLCRIYGIPAYLQFGCIYQPSVPLEKKTYWEGRGNVTSKRIGWHGWAVVYVPPWGWLPVDLTYVLGSLDDPLNAIKQAGVVALQEVIQYKNITKTDYIASRRRTGEFLQKNNFYVYELDEMTQITSEGLWQGADELTRWTLIVLVTTASIVIAIYTYFERRKKEKLSEATQPGREPRKLR